MKHKILINKRKETDSGLRKPKNLVLWALFIGLLAITVFITVQASTIGAKLVKLEDEKNGLGKENRSLQIELTRLSSLKTIESSSESLGFFEPQNIVYISGSTQVAKVP